MKRKYNRPQLCFGLIGLLFAAYIIFAPWLAGEYFIRMLSLVLIYLVLNIGLNIVAGYTGQVSLGQAGLYGIGAYFAGIANIKLGVPFWLCFPGSVAVTMLFGIALGLPTLRVSGHYLALITIGFGVIVEKLLIEWVQLTGGPSGIAVDPVTLGGAMLTERDFYFIIVAVCALSLIFAYNVVKSRYGRAFIAIRDNEVAAECMGINIIGYKLLAFVLSAALAGAAGCLYTFYNLYISPDTFSFNLSISFLLCNIIGGMGTLAGPVVGTTIMTIAPEYLQALDKYRLIIYGVVMILAIFKFPDGLVGIAYRLFPGLRTFTPPAATVQDPLDAKNYAGDSGQPVIRLQEVTKAFGGLNAINKVNMDISPATVHSLIGPNGAGKSTMINLMTGVYRPTQGSVLLEGADITGAKPHRIALTGVARTFQNAQVFGKLTVLENVMVGAHGAYATGFWGTVFRSKGFRAEEGLMAAKAYALLKLVGLQDKAGEIAENLAAGQQRMLEIARALAMEPDLLLLDEPAAGLNEVEIQELAAVINDVKKKGITTLLIEHHIDFVMEISDTVTVLNFGQKLAEGSPEAVRCNPEVIAAYLGREEG